ncbi:hypothetical protein [Serratia sp. D1N4]
MWIVPTQDDVNDLAILIKAPTTSIKAMITGCDFDVILGVENNILCYSLRIFDTIDTPLFISGCIINEEEIVATRKLTKEKKAIVYLFNELDFCIGWSRFSIELGNTGVEEKFFEKSGALYRGEIDDKCNHAMDCLRLSIEQDGAKPNPELIELYKMTIKTERWNINTLIVIGQHESNSIELDNPNEGEMLERAIWSSLESVFPLTIYKSPRVKIGDKVRELTDVLAFDDLECILIESKDLSVISSGIQRKSDRRVKGIQNQAKTAIGQLVGACNALGRGEIISSASGEELDVGRSGPHHCIALVTEISHYGDWTIVTDELMKAFRQTRSFFHLMDLRELVALLKVSKGDPRRLRVNLVKRFKLFVEKKSVHIRVN